LYSSFASVPKPGGRRDVYKEERKLLEKTRLILNSNRPNILKKEFIDNDEISILCSLCKGI
jgi:hypothetical protein